MPRWRNRTPYLLCLPLLAFLAVYFLFPVGRMMLLSLTPEQAGGDFPTLARFYDLFGEPYYQNLTVRTLRISAATTLLSLDDGVSGRHSDAQPDFALAIGAGADHGIAAVDQRRGAHARMGGSAVAQRHLQSELRRAWLSADAPDVQRGRGRGLR